MPNDGGILSDYSFENKEEIVKKYPLARSMFKPFIGAKEFLHNKERYCLWLKDISPNEVKKVPPVMDAVLKVKLLRENSNREATKKLAEYPMLFPSQDAPFYKSIKKHVNVLSQMLKYAVTVDDIPYNVADKIDKAIFRKLGGRTVSWEFLHI